MTFPTGWQRRATVTIDPVEVDGTLTDFPLLCTVANLPSEMFDADGAAPAQNGGGDIRFSSDEDGDTRLACEVVSFVTDNNPANGTAEIWVKVASVSSTVDTVVYVWYKTDATDTQPAVTDTYGRNAVWVNYDAVLHLGEDPSGSAPQMTDSTGNGNDGTSAGTMTSGDSVAVQIGDGLDFDGTDDVIDVGDLGRTAPATVELWADPSDSADRRMWSQSTGGTGQQGAARINAGTFAIWASTWQTIGTIDTSLQHLAAVFDSGGGVQGYVDGVAGYSSTSTFDFSGVSLGIADDFTASGYGNTYQGKIDEFRVSSTDRNAAWIAANYSNQNAPGTFATAGTPVDVSGPDGSGTPPPSYLLEGESRALDFHHHQMFDVITGSGEVASSGTHLNVLQCLGSGPLYNVWLSSTYPPANSGVDRVQVGDFLIIGEDDDHVWNTSNISWYKYHIEEILTNASVQSGEFRVRYIKDTENLGDDDPCNLYTTYSDGGGYSDEANEKVSMVVRRVNVDFLLGN